MQWGLPYLDKKIEKTPLEIWLVAPGKSSFCVTDSAPRCFQAHRFSSPSATMAKKRKASGRNVQQTEPQEVDPKQARLGPITTYEDVADSEDEYFINRDRLMFDEEPRSKKQRQEDEEFDFSDEEVLAYDETARDRSTKGTSATKPQSKADKAFDSDDGADGAEEEDQDGRWWGASKGEYYNADNIETEADALEEEAEAKRLQKLKLAKMAEQDFIFDENEWMNAESEKEDEDAVVTEVLKDVEITDDMGADERYRLLRTRYPEFEPLVKEFESMKAELVLLEKAAAASSPASLDAVKYWVLGCYVAALASYFAILTSPARDASKIGKPMDPVELRDHDVMETLISCREAWYKLQQTKSIDATGEDVTSIPDIVNTEDLEPMVPKTKKSRKSAKIEAAAELKREQRRKQKLAKAQAAEASVADLYNLPLSSKASRKRRHEDSTLENGDNSDFGEETTLDARAAAEKAARKKTLKFYTSQIAQKANKRAGAGRDAGGDNDLPYRERLRDRQARLMAEAERRGKRDSKHGADLGDDSGEEDTSMANAMRDDEDDYYDMVANSAKRKKEEKADKFAAYAAAGKADLVVENEEIGDDGKRKITYAIEKNKGLAPKRSKDVRNPRVKKRKQYEAKQKKLRSMRPIFKGGEPKGGYQGEKTGINANVIKSTKL